MDLGIGGQVILVVGGTGLIGTATVRRLRDEGATAVAASRHAPAGGVVMDATDDRSVTDGVARVLAEHGRLDAVVVAAAPPAQTLDPTRNSDPAQAMAAFAAKPMAFLRVANAVLPHLVAAGRGVVVGVSGQNAFHTGNITGSVRNAALVITAKNLADAVAGTGVRVNVVNPGTVRVDAASDVAIGSSGQCTPDQVADVIVFLLSARASGVSGEEIAVGHRSRGATGL